MPASWKKSDLHHIATTKTIRKFEIEEETLPKIISTLVNNNDPDRKRTAGLMVKHRDLLCNLGLYYSKNPSACPKAIEKAIEYYTKAEKIYEDAYAIIKLGDLHCKGVGFQQDGKRALEKYHIALSSQHSFNVRIRHEAALRIGCCHENGMGTEINIAEAIKYYQMAKASGCKYSGELLMNLQKSSITPVLSSDPSTPKKPSLLGILPSMNGSAPGNGTASANGSAPVNGTAVEKGSLRVLNSKQSTKTLEDRVTNISKVNASELSKKLQMISEIFEPDQVNGLGSNVSKDAGNNGNNGRINERSNNPACNTGNTFVSNAGSNGNGAGKNPVGSIRNNEGENLKEPKMLNDHEKIASIPAWNGSHAKKSVKPKPKHNILPTLYECREEELQPSSNKNLDCQLPKIVKNFDSEHNTSKCDEGITLDGSSNHQIDIVLQETSPHNNESQSQVYFVSTNATALNVANGSVTPAASNTSSNSSGNAVNGNAANGNSVNGVGGALNQSRFRLPSISKGRHNSN